MAGTARPWPPQDCGVLRSVAFRVGSCWLSPGTWSDAGATLGDCRSPLQASFSLPASLRTAGIAPHEELLNTVSHFLGEPAFSSRSSSSLQTERTALLVPVPEAGAGPGSGDVLRGGGSKPWPITGRWTQSSQSELRSGGFLSLQDRGRPSRPVPAAPGPCSWWAWAKLPASGLPPAPWTSSIPARPIDRPTDCPGTEGGGLRCLGAGPRKAGSQCGDPGPLRLLSSGSQLPWR